jgi:hypothetical protein
MTTRIADNDSSSRTSWWKPLVRWHKMHPLVSISLIVAVIGSFFLVRFLRDIVLWVLGILGRWFLELLNSVFGILPM